MLQTLKVWALRKFYRLAGPLPWRGATDLGPAGEDRDIPCKRRTLKCRVYAADAGADKPLIVYYHGGGWVIGDLDTHDPFCRALTAATGYSVLALDYRLAPQHPFPAAQDDALAAAAWIARHPERVGVPHNGRIILAGDSAGGHLACSVCLEADQPLRTQLSGAIALYPVTDHYNAMTPSYTERGKGSVLTANMMRWFWDTYLADIDGDATAAQRAMPAKASTHQQSPPTFLVTAEFDPLRDEGIAYGDILRRAGVAVTYHHFESAEHGFACSSGPTDDHKRLLLEIKQWLQTL
jgi:acetyl esterase/lipase